jgi:D-sedoheptulose 7-phosphate isomerase
MSHARFYLRETAAIAAKLAPAEIEQLAGQIKWLRNAGGRLFIAGLGGSAANASHAANDFRKLCAVEAYALNDNVAELTARANDEGWPSIYAGALAASRADSRDALLVLSVGGGTDKVSLPLVEAIKYARAERMRTLGIVGLDGGFTALNSDCVVRIPTVEPSRVTPHAEAFQSVVLHCLASHPDLQKKATKW